MFKSDDKALVVDSGKFVTVKSVLLPSDQVVTEDEAGIQETYVESNLRQGHSTVLATANPEKPNSETSWEEEALATDTSAPPKVEYDHALHTKVIALLKKTPLEFDLRGHWKNGSAIYDFKAFEKRALKDTFCYRFASDVEALALQAALTSKQPMDNWVVLGSGSYALGYEGCPYCGVKRFDLETNGATVRLTGEPCSLPNGFEPNEWELNVPSGKIVIANDLRKWFPLPEGDGDIASVNTVRGCRQTSQAYAAVGLAHGFVSNTSPEVFQLEGDRFKIANGPSEDEDEDIPQKFEGERVSHICTDLWWYSLCDRDELDRRFTHFGGSFREGIYGPRGEDEARGEVISVRPGVYRFRHNDDVDRDVEGTTFATFEWVREPDPVKDYLKDWKEVDVNPHAYVQSQVKRWPTLYGVRKGLLDETGLPWEEMTEEQKVDSWRRVADSAFCTIGGGTDWHEKGFPQAKVDPSVPDIEPPSFRQQNHWYPFSEGYGGLFRKEALTPSFAKLAFRVLESVISFGMKVNDGQHSREVPYARARMLLAVNRYRELAAKYPSEADPDYVVWLSQKDRAESWVERFDLGPVFTEKHRKLAQAQRWVPDDAYAIEFDARKLKEGHFAWASGQWANKKDAERYAIVEWEDNEQEPEHNCFWSANARKTAIPLYSVARVVKVGEVSHMGDTLVELAFDYGTAWMQNPANRKAVSEKLAAAIRVLTKEEYEKLLPKAEKFTLKKPAKKAVKKATKKAVKKAAKRTKKDTK